MLRPALPRFTSPALASLALVCACAPQDHFPSLMPRPIERQDDSASLPPPPATVPEDAQLAARLRQLLAQADEGQQAFERELSNARAAVAKAGRAGSDSWVVAQEAISRLEDARKPTVAASAELDSLALERNRNGTPTAETDWAEVAADAVLMDATVGLQADEIAKLSAALPAP